MNVAAALTHYFIPQDSNNHRARLIQTPILAILLLIFLFSQMGIHSVATQQILGYASQISPQEVVRLTNIKRQELGLSTLSENADLDRAALAKGKDMLAKGYWAHVAPDGTQPWDFFKSVGYKYRYAGENLARDFSNPSSAVDAWMASPSHRENMLSDRYKEIGVAVVDGSLAGKDATIVVQLFGTTLAGAPQIPVAAAAQKQPEVKTAVAPTVKPVFVEPTPAPLPTPAENVTPQVDSNPSAQAEFLSSSNVSRAFSFTIVGILLIAMIIDSGVIWYKGKQHIHGRPFAQIAFLGMILALIIIVKAGQIL